MGVFKRWFALTNLTVIGIALLAYNGVLTTIVTTDVSGISTVIFASFIISLIVTGVLSYRVGKDQGMSRADDNMLYIGWFIAEVLMILGLAGTVIGFIVLFDANFSDVSFDSPESVKVIIVAIASGMGVALYTTITGIIGSLLTKMLLVNVEVTINEQE
tara:strand:- start:942 stop:1418 length:477 start_codon:yes stop_codon:yes gene_type:complete